MSKPRLATLKPALRTLGATPSTRGWQPDSHRGNRHQRGYGAEWERTRERILERDKGLCQACLREGFVTAGKQCDHRVAKAIAKILGWVTERIEADENLETKCDPCHDAKSRLESHLVRHGSIAQLEAYAIENGPRESHGGDGCGR